MSFSDSKPTIAKLSLLKTPDGKKIQVIKRLAAHWRQIGDLMDFDETGLQLDIIREKYPRDPELCCREMFQYWLKGNGVKPQTWCKLIELIDDCDQEVLAEELKCVLLISPT